MRPSFRVPSSLVETPGPGLRSRAADARAANISVFLVTVEPVVTIFALASRAAVGRPRDSGHQQSGLPHRLQSQDEVVPAQERLSLRHDSDDEAHALAELSALVAVRMIRFQKIHRAPRETKTDEQINTWGAAWASRSALAVATASGSLGTAVPGPPRLQRGLDRPNMEGQRPTGATLTYRS